MKVKEAAVLFVEDEPFLRESMQAWLHQKAERVFCAEHGEGALEILAANRIDLVISDLRMPVMGGVALVKKLLEADPKPRVILVTGFSDLSPREAYEMGVDAILEKPVDREELLRAMEKSLTGADELWQSRAAAEPGIKLNMIFPSLEAALREQSIAFGRRGFCIKPPGTLHEGPVDFAVEFKEDNRVLSGQGMVRWSAAREGEAGIEITRLDDASREWVLDLLKLGKPVALIPASTAGRQASATDVA